MIDIFNRVRILQITGILAAFVMMSCPVFAETGETAAVKFMEKEIIGKYLADSYGITLYTFARDEKDVSNCIEGCAANWPPFYADVTGVGQGLDVNDFGVITRTDSRQQVTFKGMPLYYFKNDKFPGDTFGQGIGDVWSLVSP